VACRSRHGLEQLGEDAVGVEAAARQLPGGGAVALVGSLDLRDGRRRLLEVGEAPVSTSRSKPVAWAITGFPLAR
jgi:hypothetical protein